MKNESIKFLIKMLQERVHPDGVTTRISENKRTLVDWMEDGGKSYYRSGS